MNWTALSSIVASLSLILNLIQAFRNKSLKKEVGDLKQKISGSYNRTQTNHGSGGQYMADRDINLGK
ncbi:hypothetical protein [Mucilaginibacter aquatilis]|uniref:Uncharacterized protein n=1 Tax=Mucilaginibacter aquatilis TaxID=1517760 RepID=A0A6I4IEI8_9SPHI|nr:hypothetical protein [Mucilaginibacter aquatilis]MVN92036.1 hypothetical protein [Mucilaginibacter aquatilis]